MKARSKIKLQSLCRWLGAYISIIVAFCSFCPLALAGLPTGWTDVDTGSPSTAGSASDTNGGWTVAGGGGDIWGTSDQFNFVSENVTNDQSIIAEVLTDQNTSPRGWSKAGVMFRNDASAGAINAAVVASVSHGVSFQWRSTSNGDSSFTNTLGLNVPIWVKLVRTGTNFSAYYSTSGTSWIQVGASQPLSINSNFQAGLAVTAHNDSALNTATLTNVSVTALATVVSPPVITNLPAADVHTTYATLNGQVISNGNQNPFVTIYFGPADGGTNAAAWANSVTLGQQAGSYAYGLAGLATNTTYYFTALATNSAGIAWASPSQSFTTLGPPVYFTSEGFSPNNVFQFGFYGVTSNKYVLQASTNLVNWVPISTNMAYTNSLQLVDPNATNFPYRYYRVQQQ